MADSIEYVLFNIGGQKYEVSRAFLNRHPDTRMAHMEDEYNDNSVDGNTEGIYIARNGVCFPYVFEYLRDGKVQSLPLVVTKEALIADLVYFGVTAIDPDAINEHCLWGPDVAEVAKTMNLEISRLLQIEAHSIGLQHDYAMFARVCMERFRYYGVSKVYQFNLEENLEEDKVAIRVAKGISCENYAETCNQYLHRVGLEISSLMQHRFEDAFVVRLRVIGGANAYTEC